VPRPGGYGRASQREEGVGGGTRGAGKRRRGRAPAAHGLQWSSFFLSVGKGFIQATCWTARREERLLSGDGAHGATAVRGPVRGAREKPRTRYPERTSDKTKIRTTPPPFRYPPLIGVPQITSQGLAARRVVNTGDPLVPRAAGERGHARGPVFVGSGPRTRRSGTCGERGRRIAHHTRTVP